MRLRSPLLLLLLALLMLATGCERTPGTGLIAEIDDADYVRGKSLLRQNRNQEAMAAFLKVIDKRAGDAAESHLEVGRLYHEQIKDPIQAIYHYRKYRELKPNAPQSQLVGQLIQAATRDFARTLPAQPLENQVLRNDLLDVVERLQRENTQLKADLAAIGAGRPASVISLDDPGTSGPVQAFGSLSAGTLTTRGPIEAADAPQISQAPVQTVAAAPTATVVQPTPAPATGGRRHVVAQGESLYSIARRYYGTPTNARISEIVAANRELLPNDKAALKIGMELRIP
ncbi:MAG TPA: LysM peptidoglycan-binding domain-containing protein [Opitutaceae bacterium]